MVLISQWDGLTSIVEFAVMLSPVDYIALIWDVWQPEFLTS